MDILRSLAGFAGILVAIFGFMLASSEWMLGRPQFWGHWVVLIIGAVMWLQSLPLLVATFKEKLRKPGNN
jgi:Kef-type K+ transport system membrane component KefB